MQLPDGRLHSWRDQEYKVSDKTAMPAVIGCPSGCCHAIGLPPREDVPWCQVRVLYSFENYKVKKIISWNNLVIAITSLPPQIINLVIASLWNVISRVKFHRTKVLLLPFESSHRDLSEFDSSEYLHQSQQKSFSMISNRAVQFNPNQSESIRITPNRSESVQIDPKRRNWAAVTRSYETEPLSELT